MDVEAFLNEVRSSPDYKGQAVYVREVEVREARFADTARPLLEPVRRMLAGRGIERLYTHQAEAVDRVREGRNVLVATGTASGKSLCYVIPILEMLAGGEKNSPRISTDEHRQDGEDGEGGRDAEDRGCANRTNEMHPSARRQGKKGEDGRQRGRGTALLLFPTKALCQDQFKNFSEALKAAGLDDVLAGVYDGDTPSAVRRKLRDRASVVFTNPDMLHSALMPEHGRWANFLSRLKLLVIDELHVYNGMFGSNAANLFRRFFRVCGHYGAKPQVVSCTATIGNPRELAERLLGEPVTLVENDGSPRGRRTYVFWNPPRVRGGDWRSRRSANVEAHELMAMLVQRGVPTITFSKAKMTAEMIYRYVCDKLRESTPQLAKKVSAYRGGYLPQERREIERRLFTGELLGVSTTRALELGIDVGGLDASIIVGYPGTLASFFQQSGRAGRQDRDALVVLVGLDTAVNQFVMTQPEYVFGRPVEQGVIDPDNPFVITGHLRCVTHELPLPDEEAEKFGPYAELVLRVLEDNLKVKHIEGRWYHAAPETPQHEFSLRDYSGGTVLIEDADTGAVLGQLDRFDAPPIVHPGAIYMHHGDTYEVVDLNMETNLARVKRVDVDYYTQPLGGQDVHHIDHRLREKPFGTGTAYWGEVTAYDRTWGYERVHFYSLDAVSQHRVNLPQMVLETMAFWLVPPEPLMEEVRQAGLDVHAGLRGVGYATKMLLPLFITCETLDFSHSIGSVNSPWNAVFLFEKCTHGLGFSEKAYELLDRLMPAVLAHIRKCTCEDGCPCCVGKPLRMYATWNVERAEGSIPSRRAAIAVLQGLLGEQKELSADYADERRLSSSHLCPSAPSADEIGNERLRLECALRRRLERMREPQVLHPIEPKVDTAYPEPVKPAELEDADVARRAGERRRFQKELHRRLAKRIDTGQLSPTAGKPQPPPGMTVPGSGRKPTDFAGSPARRQEKAARHDPPKAKKIIGLTDSLADRARKLKKRGDK